MEITDWKKELKRLKLEDIKSKSPGFFEQSGGYKMKVKSYSDNTANELTKCIIDWLNFNGHYANRINTMGVARVKKVEYALGRQIDKVHFTPSTTNKGTADISAIIKGRHAAIEVKYGRDKQSKQQEEEQARIEKAGGLYFIAKDMESFIHWYNKIITV